MADGGQDFDLGLVVGSQGAKGDKGDTGATGNGIQSIILRSTVGKVKTYRITYTNGDTFDFQVTDGEDGSSSEVEIVTSWNNTLSDEKVPSEKLSKNTLDGKAPTSHASSSNTYGLGSTSNYGHVKTINGLTQSSHSDGTALSAYQGKVLKDAIDTKPDSSDIPTKTSDLTNDSNYISTSSTSGLIKNDGTIDTTSYSTFSGSYNDLSNKPTIPSASTTTPSADTSSGSYGSGTSYARSNHTHPKSSLYAEATHSHTKSQITDFPTIPSKTSDLTNDGADGTNVFVANNDSRLSDARTPTSHTHGNLTNDGKVGSTANYFVYTTTSGAITSKQKIGNITTSGAIGSTANKPLITTTNGVITTGSFGTSANSFCEGNDSRLSDARTPTAHTHTVSNITDFPTIPSKTSDLTNDSNFISTSSTTGLIKNDGSIMTSGTGSGNYSAGNHTHSGYVSATKVTSWQSTPSDSNVPSEKLVSDTFAAIEDLIGNIEEDMMS